MIIQLRRLIVYSTSLDREGQPDDLVQDLLRDADVPEPGGEVLDATEDDRRGQELEAEGGEPPPVQGDVQVEAGVVVADGGHHGDLEVHL